MIDAPARGHGALLALGCNVGDRLAHLRNGARRLAGGLEGATASSVYRTPPAEGADPPDYFNAVLRGVWPGSTRELLELARRVEEMEGRSRTHRGAPRTLDVDIIFLGGHVIREADLRVPHPRWRRRAFVVVPLLEVAPDLVDPESGRPVSEVVGTFREHSGEIRMVAGPEALLPSGDRGLSPSGVEGP